ncbi:MAG: hypothetical protein M1820_000452 [Bogoriella megaspora]|nr:MAG: hypothetical protein M1820_000452 [Bogoriella megaspora]
MEIAEINSPAEFSQYLNKFSIVVVDFWAPWCQPCKTIAPLYQQLSQQLSRPGQIIFTKVNTDQQTQIAQSYTITTIPTFLVFKRGKEVSRVRGAEPKQLSEVVKKLAQEADSTSSSGGGFGEASSSGSGNTWLGASLPRGYSNVTDQIDVRGLDLLNVDSSFGDGRTLFHDSAPSAVTSHAKGKSKDEGSSNKGEGKADWVESDTDEQLMLYLPFQSTVKVHTLHITSLPPTDSDDDEAPTRPKTLRFYTNRSNNLGFDEADGTPATQEIALKPEDWDKETGTAKVELRFVKFQNVTSLVVFVVDGEEEGKEKVRVDRIRVVGETGEKRAMGKLEKIGDQDGE